jgi:DNA uptake protein ComE-like DNA-binding protein
MNLTIAVAMCLALVACRNDSRDRAETGDAAEAAGDVATATPLVDPNSVTEAEVLAVPGMNEAAADALMAGRPYDDMLEVDRVLSQHLNEQQRDSVYGRLWRRLDLNTATGEEILLIPGVGPRMQREFEEYRPYTSLAQFRREIGKYVDGDEVARLERYVTIR